VVHCVLFVSRNLCDVQNQAGKQCCDKNLKAQKAELGISGRASRVSVVKKIIDRSVFTQTLIIARHDWVDDKYLLGLRGGDLHLNKVLGEQSTDNSNIAMFFADVSCVLLPPGKMKRKMWKESKGNIFRMFVCNRLKVTVLPGVKNGLVFMFTIVFNRPAGRDVLCYEMLS